MSKFRMTAGDTKILAVTVIDEDGAAVDISGTSIRFQIARLATDPTPLVAKTTVGDAGGVEITDGPAGRFDVTLLPNDTAELSGSYHFEAEVNDGDLISTVLSGRATIDAALIRP